MNAKNHSSRITLPIVDDDEVECGCCSTSNSTCSNTNHSNNNNSNNSAPFQAPPETATCKSNSSNSNCVSNNNSHNNNNSNNNYSSTCSFYYYNKQHNNSKPNKMKVVANANNSTNSSFRSLPDNSINGTTTTNTNDNDDNNTNDTANNLISSDDHNNTTTTTTKRNDDAKKNHDNSEEEDDDEDGDDDVDVDNIDIEQQDVTKNGPNDQPNQQQQQQQQQQARRRSSNFTQRSNNSTNGGNGNGLVRPIDIHDTTSKAVRFWRHFLLIVLVSCMIMTTIIVYHYTSSQQQETLERDFVNDANKIQTHIGRSLDISFTSLESFILDIKSIVTYTNQIWPFVTVPDYAIRAAKIRSITSAATLTLYPYVAKDQRTQWEHYSATHNQWVKESISIQSSSSYNDNNNNTLNDTTNVEANYNISNTIFGQYTSNESGTKNSSSYRSVHEYYFPMWQNSPTIFSPPYNWDYMSAFSKYIYSLMSNQKIVVSRALILPNYTDPIELLKLQNRQIPIRSRPIIDQYVGPYDERSEPMSAIMFPILIPAATLNNTNDHDTTSAATTSDTSSSSSSSTSKTAATTTTTRREMRSSLSSSMLSTTNSSSNSNNNTVVAFVTMRFYWRDILKVILPKRSYGIIIVLENECNPTYTYKINGPDVDYLGSEDVHDPMFESMVQTTTLVQATSSLNNAVDGDICQFTIRVYPTTEMRNSYITLKPALLSGLSILMFAFTSMVFLIYNYSVDRRQREILHCAIRSSVNVDELDKIIQDRTAELQKTKYQLQLANYQIQKASAQQLEHFASMSHEIRTPLNGINGLSSVIRQDLLVLERDGIDITNKKAQLRSTIARTVDSMQLIVSSGELLRTIVDDVLDFAKLGSGKVEMDIKPNMNLQDILDNVVASIESFAQFTSKQLVIRTKYGSMVHPYLSTDSRRLQHVLTNLLGNAVKFSPQQGIIELQAYYYYNTDNYYYTPPSLDKPSGTKSNGKGATTNEPWLRFSVKDYGKGIAKDKFQVIFEPFVQTNGVVSEVKHGGTGLGLAITARLVEALGGVISVDSQLGEWTEFRVDFPLQSSLSSTALSSPSTVPTTPPLVTRSRTWSSNSTTGNTTNTSTTSPSNTSGSFGNMIQPPPSLIRLATVILYLVDDDIGDKEQMEKVFQDYKLAYKSFSLLGDMEQELTRSVGAASERLILIRQRLVDPFRIQNSPILKTTKTLTFGNVVGSTDVSHGTLPSLTRILPSILLQRIVDCLESDSYVVPQYHGFLSNGGSNHNTSPNKPDNDDDALSGLRVLIAEDNLVNQKVLVRILQRLKIQYIVVVSDGKEAVEREEQEPFDVIFMDMNMPVMDGIEATKLIVARHEALQSSTSSKDNDTKDENGDDVHHPDTKIIFLTATVSESDEKLCLDAGAIGFQSKPCSLECIRACLQSISR